MVDREEFRAHALFGLLSGQSKRDALVRYSRLIVFCGSWQSHVRTVLLKAVSMAKFRLPIFFEQRVRLRLVRATIVKVSTFHTGKGRSKGLKL